MRLVDLVVDGSDTFATRYLVNDACVLEGKPDVYGAIFRFDGQVSVFGVAGGPCYRCLYPEAPPEHLVPSCSEGGVLGVLAGMVGSFQANEAIKLLLGNRHAADRAAAADRRARRPRARVCAWRAIRPACCAATRRRFATSAPNPNAAHRRRPSPNSTSTRSTACSPAVRSLLDVREPHERALGEVPGALAIPATALEARMHELDTAKTYVVACRVGAKSRWAAQRLKEAGFGKVYHLRDGLLALAARDDAFDLF